MQKNFEAAGHFRNFTGILNSALRDKRLSYRAKGILAACLSHSDGFEFTKEWILEHGTEGRDAVISALKELRAHGYLLNIKVKCKATGRILGERFRFTDQPEPSTDPASVPEPKLPQVRRTGNPDAGYPDAGNPASGFPGRNRKPIERKPIERKTTRGGAGGEQPLELPDWLEPCRSDLESWQANRAITHKKLKPGLTKSSLEALEFARKLGVLKEFCSYASEKSWQSLGFIGYKEQIEKLARQCGTMERNGFSSNSIKPVVYTIK